MHRKGEHLEIVVVANRKGGVAKSSTALALGAGLIRNGYKVLYIDLDSQTNLTNGLGAREEGVVSSWDVLTGAATAAQAIQHTPQGDVIGGSEALAGADIAIAGTGREYCLKNALDAIGGAYDYVIIDTPPALGTLTINALTAANSVIIPAQADEDSIKGIHLLNRAIQAVKRHCNRNLYIRGILITRYNGRAIYSRDMQDNLQATAALLKTKLYSTTIRENVAIKEARSKKRDIFSYSGKSNGARDYRAFVKEFLEESAKETTGKESNDGNQKKF